MRPARPPPAWASPCWTQETLVSVDPTRPHRSPWAIGVSIGIPINDPLYPLEGFLGSPRCPTGDLHSRWMVHRFTSGSGPKGPLWARIWVLIWALCFISIGRSYRRLAHRIWNLISRTCSVGYALGIIKGLRGTVGHFEFFRLKINW